MGKYLVEASLSILLHDLFHYQTRRHDYDKIKLITFFSRM